MYLMSDLSASTQKWVAKATLCFGDGVSLSKIVLFALVYAALGKLTFSFLSVDGQLLNMWVSTGVAVALLLIRGVEYWPGIFIGATLGALWGGGSLGAALGIALGNTLGPLASVRFLQYWYHTSLKMKTLSDYLYIATAGVICAFISAIISILAVWVFETSSPIDALYGLVHWWQGDLLGVLVISVSILVWQSPPMQSYSHLRLSEVFLFAGLTILAAFAIYSDWGQGWLESYLMFAFVAWGGVRYKMHGALFVIAVCTSVGVAYVFEGKEAYGEVHSIYGLTNFWMYLMALTVIGTVLALSILEKEQLENAAITRSEVLQKLYTGATLQEVLDFAVCLIEKHNPEIHCSIVTFDDYGTPTNVISAPGMQRLYPSGINGILARLSLQVCETQQVAVKNVYCDAGWQPHLEFANQLNIRSCYSTPSKGSNGKLLGVFSIYKEYEGSPSMREQAVYSRIATLIALVTEQNRISEELQLASLIFGNSSEAMTVTDAHGIILAVNPAFTEVTGYELKEVKGHKTSILSSDFHDKTFYQKMWQDLEKTGEWQGEIWNKKKNGDLYPEWLTINTVYNNDGTAYRRVALFSDLSGQKESEKLIWQQANLDGLTKLPNRAMFHDLLIDTMCEADYTGLPVALLFIDLDRFKDVNDSLGHHKGDDLLKQVADRISTCVRQSDVVARLGGDEFTVILKQISDTKSPDRVAADIIEALSSPYSFEEGEVNYLSASIGISLYPGDAQDAEALLKNADQAMYAAKGQGRNRYQHFTPQMEEETRERIQLTSDLKTAISKQELVAYYQPIVDLQKNSVYKAELLLRWSHPERGFVSPADFIPLAEETGLIIEIGDWVFKEALQQVKDWRSQLDEQFQISVNASPIQFQDATSKLNEWTQLLEQYEVAGSSVAVEITESLLMQSGAQVTDTLKGFRDAGLNISLDDFGTGYSSLSYLRQLDIDFLKIDQSFVRHLRPSSNELALCEAIITMAHKLGIKVIAEGIETEEQRRLLMNAECDFGQGYLFSKPVPAAQFECWYQHEVS